MSDLKTELLHKIMMLGADTYNKAHQDRYKAQIKANELLEAYILERNKANEANKEQDKALNKHIVSFSEERAKVCELCYDKGYYYQVFQNGIKERHRCQCSQT